MRGKKKGFTVYKELYSCFFIAIHQGTKGGLTTYEETQAHF